MRYVYSVVRFVPDPIRGEFVNVGAIVGSDESSEWAVRTIENQKRARSIDDKGVLAQFLSFIDDVGRKLDVYTDSIEQGVEPGFVVSESWLRRLWEESRNVVQLSLPTPVIADSLQEVADLLFDQFILEPESRRFPFRKKHTALAAVRRAYAASGLYRGTHFAEGSLVRGAHHKERFDFVVANGDALQLAHAWSFQVPGQEDLAESIKAWAWTVRDIRGNGGDALADNRRVVVPRGVDVQVVYVEPAAGGPTAVLEEALSAFRELTVTALPVGEAPRVGARALELLGPGL